jgi:hypothetical protein
MTDTNQVQQAAQAVQDVASQVKANWPAISAAAFIVAREIGRFNAWVRNLAEFVIGHGGIGWLIWKLIWNPSAPAEQQLRPTTATPNEGKTS